MITNTENITSSGLEFLKFINRIEESGIETHLIPIKARKKTPDTFGSWVDINLTSESSFARVNELHSNVAIVAHEHNEKTNKDGICVLDVDLVEGKFQISKTQLDELFAMNTLVVKTKSGSFQFYFVNKGITEHLKTMGFSSNPKYRVEGGAQECGELRTSVAYMLIPGSYVPIDYEGGKKGSLTGATGLYSVYSDNPIKVLTPEILPKWIIISNAKTGASAKESDSKVQEEFINKPIKVIDEQIGFTIATLHKLEPDERIVNEKGLDLNTVIENDREFAEILMSVGERGTRSERDWYVCRKMRAMGFTPNDCSTALFSYRFYEKSPGAGVHAYARYIALTIRNAYTREISSYDPQQNRYAEYDVSDIEKVSNTELPEDLPEERFILVQAPPRTGKTHWSVHQLVKAKTGVYITGKHEIIRHAIHIFRSLEKLRTAVYIVGKDRACNRTSSRGECGSCPKCPHVHPGMDDNGRLRTDVLTTQKLRTVASSLLYKHRILTPEVLMSDETICPYFVLLLAEYEADFVFTIPYFLTSDRELKRVKRTDRNILVIDEDPVVTSFYPSEYEIASYSYGRGTKNFTNVLGTKMDTINNIEKVIGEQKRKSAADKEILRLCGLLHTLDDRMNTVVDSTTVEGKRDFDTWLKTFDVSNDYDTIMKLEIEKRLKKIEQGMQERDREVELVPMFAPFLYVSPKTFLWLGGSPNKTLYVIAERTVQYVPPGFYKKILIIGATQSELYIQDVCKDPKQSKIISIDSFKYAGNFLLMRLKAPTRKEESRMLYNLMFRIAEENASNDLVSPALVLTSSIKKQTALSNKLKSKCCTSTDQSEDEHISLWMNTNLNIFYSNSTLSRGLDIPQYSTMFVESVKFAIPYFTAVMEHAQETGNIAMVKRAKAIISKVTVDEITNSVLRHSPTMDNGIDEFKKEERIKIIVIRDRDASSIAESVTKDMVQLDINTMENIELGFKLTTLLPDGFLKSSISETLAKYCPDPIIHHYVVKYSTGCRDRVSESTPNSVLKTDLVSVIEKNLRVFPKNNAILLVDPKIKSIVKNIPALNDNHRLSEVALIKFISSQLNRKVKKVPANAHAPKAPPVVEFGDLKPDKRYGLKGVPMEGFIRKMLSLLIKGDLLKTEMDNGKKFYRRVSKEVYDQMTGGI